jgi:hypothetical protein
MTSVRRHGVLGGFLCLGFAAIVAIGGCGSGQPAVAPASKDMPRESDPNNEMNKKTEAAYKESLKKRQQQK